MCQMKGSVKRTLAYTGHTTDQATMPSTCKCEEDPIKIHYLFPKMSLEAHQFYHCKWFKRCLVGWLIDSQHPGKQYFSHVGTEPPLPVYNQYLWGVNVPCSRTQYALTQVGLELPTSGSGVRGIKHQATALP